MIHASFHPGFFASHTTAASTLCVVVAHAEVTPEATMPREPAALGIGTAVEHLVPKLPPKERACVLLKDVFDYSLEEIAGCDIEGEFVILNTAKGRHQDKNIRRDPRVALVIVDPDNPYRYLDPGEERVMYKIEAEHVHGYNSPLIAD